MRRRCGQLQDLRRSFRRFPGNGQPSYVDDPALDISEFMAQAGANENEYKPGARSLVSLQADEAATVEYYLYLEGCDEQCSNAVQKQKLGACAGVCRCGCEE